MNRKEKTEQIEQLLAQANDRQLDLIFRMIQVVIK